MALRAVTLPGSSQPFSIKPPETVSEYDEIGSLIALDEQYYENIKRDREAGKIRHHDRKTPLQEEIRLREEIEKLKIARWIVSPASN
ncbi:MAG: hypothetical protein ACHQRM_04490 [Bacteroidia bacterium]